LKHSVRPVVKRCLALSAKELLDLLLCNEITVREFLRKAGELSDDELMVLSVLLRQCAKEQRNKATE
jgi:hypothetical protein